VSRGKLDLDSNMAYYKERKRQKEEKEKGNMHNYSQKIK
jgi:hypothetical protein